MKSFKSRKFIVFAVALAAFLANHFTGNHVDDDTIKQMLVLITGWLVSQGIADVGWTKAAEIAESVSENIEELAEPDEGESDEASKTSK